MNARCWRKKRRDTIAYQCLTAFLRSVHGSISWTILGMISTRSASAARIACYLIIVAAVFSGLIGHDPWKQDETYIFGIVQHLIESGDWVVPRVAGESFMEKPPLYYWVAATLSQALFPWLPLHDGARIASGVFMSITSLAAGLTAQKMWGAGAGTACVLVLVGCLGTAMYSHFMVTDLAVMAGTAICLAAFPYIWSRPALAGVLLGFGTGVGFLGKGLLLPGIVGVSCLLLPALFPAWRKRKYFFALAIAAIVAMPALLIWPTLLYFRAPSLFYEWFWINNVGRFFGFSVSQLGAPHRPGYWWQIMPWFAFPSLPLAFVTLWTARRTFVHDQRIQCLTTFSVVYMVMLALAASAREAYALPLLVIFALLAAPCACTLSRRISVSWAGLSACSFSVVAATIWTVWIFAALDKPLNWPWLNQKIFVDPSTAVVGNNFWIAVVVTTGAILSVGYYYAQKMIGLMTWVTGLTLCWTLLATLWMPWIDDAKSYRQLFYALAQQLPKNMNCLASTGLGESERAMLHYFIGSNTQRTEIVGDQGCAYLLVEGLAQYPPHDATMLTYTLLWQGARQRDERERFWLFRK